MFFRRLIALAKHRWIHRWTSSFSSLSADKKKEILRFEADEFIKKYGSVINALANE